MDTKRWWIVGHDDQPWGPYETSAVAALAAAGKLRSDGLVCMEGESRWSPIGTVAELAEIPWPPAPVTEPRLPPDALGTGSSALRFNELAPIPAWATVLLSIPTLGLWGVFNFYRTMRVFQRLAGNPPSNAETLFWVVVCVAVLGVLTLPIHVGWVLLAAAVIAGALLVRETLRLRDLAILRLVPHAASQPARYPAVKSDDWHFGLWLTGAVLTVTGIFAIVGLPILVAQALAWFEDWNHLAALARGAPTAGPVPA